MFYSKFWNVIHTDDYKIYYDEPHLQRYIHVFDKFQYILIAWIKCIVAILNLFVTSIQIKFKLNLKSDLN